ncbi:hypothetical protein ANN_15753 [Periplaneta americana]|uniref:Uncharacterized protein n=1 Tax=Periplaneta americana TaxID=6978 RepID=A0ABQ8SH40_PERAM|nr:hypothetical protein ANN_15753 [Periplaneta americana]
MIFGKMRPRIRHRLPDICFTVWKISEKTQPGNQPKRESNPRPSATPDRQASVLTDRATLVTCEPMIEARGQDLENYRLTNRTETLTELLRERWLSWGGASEKARGQGREHYALYLQVHSQFVKPANKSIKRLTSCLQC